MLSKAQQLSAAEASHSSLKQDDLLELIRNRRSIRRYSRRKPCQADIDRIISCAAFAPSAHNAQPWRFFVLNDESKKAALIEQMALRFRQDLKSDEVDEEEIKVRVQESVKLFSDAPVIIIACIDMVDMDKYPDTARQQAETTMATQSLAAAIQNLLLAARAVGLSGCWYCAPLFCPEVVKSTLHLPEGSVPQALLTVGYPSEKPLAPSRLELDEIRSIL